MNTYHIALIGGGTGGHVYPALAVLEQLQDIAKIHEIQFKILWIGSNKGIEKNIISVYRDKIQAQSKDAIQLEFYGILCGKLRRYFSWRNFSDVFLIVVGILQSYRILRRIRPQLLFSKGGFVSVPGLIAAKLLGIPSLGHESDLDPGLATRLGLPLVEAMFVPYEQSLKYYKDCYQRKLQVSGNPVRKEFFTPQRNVALCLPSHWLQGTEQGETVLGQGMVLVMGGSLGALELNEYVRDILSLAGPEPGFYLVHQCGEADYPSLSRLEAEYRHYRVFPFITQGLGSLYQLCRHSRGLVVSRAGAGSLWEILASGNRAILLPLQSGSRGDQVRNAELFERQGWAQYFRSPDSLIERNSQNLLAQIYSILQYNSDSHTESKISNAAQYIAQYIWEELTKKRL